MLSVHSCPFGELGAENTGGMSVYIRELCKELGRRGHIVDVFTRTHEPIHDQIIEFGQNARLIHFKAGDEELKITIKEIQQKPKGKTGITELFDSDEEILS